MNPNRPRVSVVIPTYNCGKYIREAIHSVLNQNYKYYEVIIVDDGSIDDTKEILKPYIEEQKIRYIFQNNSGPSAARNRGIRLSQGEYIAFLDADDAWVPAKLEKQIKFLDNYENVGMVFSDISIFNERGVISSSFLEDKKIVWKIPASSDSKSGIVFLRSIFGDLLQENFIPTKTVLLRRKCIDEVGFFDESLLSVEDRDMWLRIAKDYAVGFINEPLAMKRVHSSNIGSNIQLALDSQLRVMNKMLKICPRELPLIKKVIIQNIKNINYELGYRSFSNNNLRQARIHFAKSINDGGFNLKLYIYLIATYCPLKLINLARGLKKRIN